MLLNIFLSISITSLLFSSAVVGLENGLARTPPMGWLSWLRFGCQTDCKNNPKTCISENLVVDMVDRMVADGFKDAGYQYVNLDDCWLAGSRDPQGRLQADPARFPHGMKWLTDYVHKNGLKFGIYEDYGTKTCAGFPGSLGHVEQDAQTFADWGVDYVKFDACNVKHEDIDIGYPQMSLALNKTNRPMVYSCEWAFYSQFYLHQKPNYTNIRHYCNVWRVFDDIGTDWSSILKTINYYDQNQEDLIAGSGPGGWNDPDMLSVGNPGLSVDQARAQFAMWAIYSSPLLMSTDLRTIDKTFKNILLNKKVIAINQDSLGVMGRLVVNTTDVAVYLKPVMPLKRDTNDASYAIAFFNRNPTQMAEIGLKSFESLGLKNKQGYEVQDLYSGKEYGTMYPADSFSTTLNPSSILLLKATILL